MPADGAGRSASLLRWRRAAALLLVLVAKPETARFYLKYVFAWLPAGSILVAATLGWIAVRRRNVAFDARAQVAFVIALLLVGFSYSVYAAYWPYPNPNFPQETAYAMPVIATFLAWVHLRGLPVARAGPGRHAADAGRRLDRRAGDRLLRFLLVHDARKETVAITASTARWSPTRPTPGSCRRRSTSSSARPSARSRSCSPRR